MQDYSPGSSILHGTTAGNQQIADASKQREGPAAWRAAIELLQNFPRVLLAVFATSLAALLLKILRIASFILDFRGRNLDGKNYNTSVLRGERLGCWEVRARRSRTSSTPGMQRPTFLERLTRRRYRVCRQSSMRPACISRP